jgi:beta-glucosidase
MVMVPFRFKEFIAALTQAVEKGDIPLSRIDDAVRRILRVKVRMGLFEHPLTDKSWLDLVGDAPHREIAREAVRKSAVLLKNENSTLPVPQDISTIFVAGKSANDLGLQCGGWTIDWGGHRGNIMQGTTFLDALKSKVSSTTTVVYDLEGNFKESPGMAELGIAVVGEFPYVEGTGDRADLALSEEDVEAINQLRQRCKKLLVILYSGRPMIITDHVDLCDAIIAAWLPGTEGAGLTDVVFGDYPFTGKLPYTWPRSMAQIPLQALKKDSEPPLYPFGFGLTVEKVASATVTER